MRRTIFRIVAISLQWLDARRYPVECGDDEARGAETDSIAPKGASPFFNLEKQTSILEIEQGFQYSAYWSGPMPQNTGNPVQSPVLKLFLTS